MRTGCASSAPGYSDLERGQGRAAVPQPACLSPRESRASPLRCCAAHSHRGLGPCWLVPCCLWPLLMGPLPPTVPLCFARAALAHQLCTPCEEFVHRQRKEGLGWAAEVEPGEGLRPPLSENKARRRQRAGGSHHVCERGPTASTPKDSWAARGVPATAPAPSLAPAAAPQLLTNSCRLLGRFQPWPGWETLV